MRYSRREKRDLFYAGILISLAFAILLSGGFEGIILGNSNILILFFVSFFSAGLGFLLHELAHKYVAQSYGLFAEFKASYSWLFLAILFSLGGFIIAAPGAVFISGRTNREKDGKISAAGPLTNIILAIVFLVGFLIYSEGLIGLTFIYGLRINAILGAFNMIPVIPFDGAKIIAWDKLKYSIILLVAVGLTVISYI